MCVRGVSPLQVLGRQYCQSWTDITASSQHTNALHEYFHWQETDDR